MDAGALETWGRTVVVQAADTVAATIPAAQRPEAKSVGRARTSRPGYSSRLVHFRHPTLPLPFAVWLYVAPAGHQYGFPGRGDVAAAGLMQDSSTELAEQPRAAGLARTGPFVWRRHCDDRYAGWRLVMDVEPDRQAPEEVAGELAGLVVRALRRVELVP